LRWSRGQACQPFWSCLACLEFKIAPTVTEDVADDFGQFHIGVFEDFWMRCVCRAISRTNCGGGARGILCSWIGAGGTKLLRISASSSLIQAAPFLSHLRPVMFGCTSRWRGPGSCGARAPPHRPPVQARRLNGHVRDALPCDMSQSVGMTSPVCASTPCEVHKSRTRPTRSDARHDLLGVNIQAGTARIQDFH
jgi:hypothetical protein